MSKSTEKIGCPIAILFFLSLYLAWTFNNWLGHGAIVVAILCVLVEIILIIKNKFDEKIEDGMISGNEIIPYAMGGPFEKYKITNLTGAMTDKTLRFEMVCGEYPTKYSGSR